MRPIDNRVADVAKIDLVRHALTHSRVEGVVIHRLELPKATGGADADAVQVARFFSDRSLHTGGEMPYHFLVRPDGKIEQALDLDDAGQHARAWNARAYGVACMGDFRKVGATRGQWNAAKALTVDLLLYLGPRAWVKGHDELPGGSGDPSKECPGKLWHMEWFRDECMAEVDAASSAILRAAIDEDTIKLFGELSLRRYGVTL